MNRRYRKTVIAGNWKMNMTATETKKFAEELKKIMPRAKWCDTLICVPACNIQTAAKAFKDLRISVITTKRAYADLEQDGFIETAPGKGSFVHYQDDNETFAYRNGAYNAVEYTLDGETLEKRVLHKGL